MPEPAVERINVGAHVLELPRWACTWCGLRLADRSAVVRHEAGCPQRDDALW